MTLLDVICIDISINLRKFSLHRMLRLGNLLRTSTSLDQSTSESHALSRTSDNYAQLMLCREIYHQHCWWTMKDVKIFFLVSEEEEDKLLFLNIVAQHFFSIWIFFHEHSRFTRQQGKGTAISMWRHLDISWAITAESSLLHIASSWNRTGNLSERKSLTTKLRDLKKSNITSMNTQAKIKSQILLIPNLKILIGKRLVDLLNDLILSAVNQN